MVLPEVDSLDSFGGAMSNYTEVVDPTTDEDAAFRNAYVTDVAMMTHTITRAARSFLGTTGGATMIADPSSGFVHDAVWGSSPSVKPSATYIATGTLDLIWPSTVTDELGDSHTVQLRRATASVESSDGTFRLATAKVIGSAKVRVYTYENGALADLAGEVITVFVV